MRILVMADTHGYLGVARRACLEHGPWDHVVHLGDSLDDAVALAAELGIDVVAVAGNNEPPSPEGGDELFFRAQGVGIFAVHGHRQGLCAYDEEGLAAGLSALARSARARGAEVALFGHTHRAVVRECEGVLLVNPGGMGLGDPRRTYAEVIVEGPGQVRALIRELLS